MTTRETHTLTVVVYDSAPDYVDPTAEHSLEVGPEPGIPDEVTAELSRLVREADSTLCKGCENNPVGFALHEPLDYDDRGGGMRWQYTTVVVRVGRAAWSLCEDCTMTLLPPGAGL